MDQDTYDQFFKAIKDRGQWESKQDTWYKMRHTGIRRPVKPYPHAPDQHYPLGDSIIEKLKPFYGQQIYANERVATFISEKGASREAVIQAEQFFDYNIKQRSNFEHSLLIGVDTFLQSDFCPLKIYWDTKQSRLAYDPIDPLYIIVPSWTEGTQDADWLIHVMRVSVAQYKAKKDSKGQPYYRQDLVDRISGRGAAEMNTSKEQDMAAREGITYCKEDDQIVIWECYVRQNGKWVIETISPIAGRDEPLREPFGLPYKHGKLPFVQLRAEITEKGWYSPRGVMQVTFKHELDLCKMWNAKLQYLDFFGQPNFKNNSLQPLNASNFTNQPGKILPPGIEKEDAVSAPLDFEKEMQFVRALAEDRVRIPDLGASESLTGPASNTKGGKTATAVNAIVGLSNQSNDLRARVFRLQLGEIYEQSWSLLCQFAGDQLQYIYQDKINTLPPEALADTYTIQPSGSADSWNVAARQQKALGLYQLLFGKPNVNQDELLKWTLENGDDPLLVKRLFQDAGDAQRKQGERQASEINNMLIGYPVSVNADDQDAVHLQTLIGFAERRMQTGEGMTPEFLQLAFGHAQEHVQALANKKDKSANMWKQALGQIGKLMSQGQMPQQGGSPQQSGGAMPQQPGLPAPQGQPMLGMGDSGAMQPQQQQPQAMNAGGVTIALPKVEFDTESLGQVFAQMAQTLAAAQQPQQAPVVNVQVPPQQAPTVNVQVPPQPRPVVNVQQPPAKVNVEAAAAKVEMPSKSKIKVIRNEDGEITGAEVERK